MAGALKTGDTLPVPGGVGRRFTYNGDGTITDSVTGLMREKLSDDDSIHDWDNSYTWADAFAVKIASLNSTDFAGYSDWRVPDRFELETLVNLGTYLPVTWAPFNTDCTPGCTVTTCSCTASAWYWSATTDADGPAGAWGVGFNYGGVYGNHKLHDYLVRAVRGGS